MRQDMDSSDRDVSSDAPSPSSSTGGSRDKPNCGKCRNHGVIVPLRGHKRDCPNRDCVCACCILTHQRRDVMARQNTLNRQRKQTDRPHVVVATGTPRPVSRSSIQPLQPLPTTGPVPVASAPGPSLQRSRDFPANKRLGLDLDLDEHSQAANELIKIFGLQMNALPFCYAVLAVTGDLNSAYHYVMEAKRELTMERAGPSAFSTVSSRSPPSAIDGAGTNGHAAQGHNHHAEHGGQGGPTRHPVHSRMDLRPISLVKYRYDVEQRYENERRRPNSYSSDSSLSPPQNV